METIIKKEAQTNPVLGKHIAQRSVEELIAFGCINLDKPSGPTSHQVSDYVQRILKIKKAGHGGSLDPRVTGILPVTLEHASRLSEVMLKGGKEYVGIMHLHSTVPIEKIRETIAKFTGKITQMPPVKSAVKRQLRERTIYSFEILEIEDKDILFKVSCQAGTYIRKLCHDFGIVLGVGAHMADLRRTRAGYFTEEDCVSLQDVKDAYTLWKEENNEKFIRYCIKPAERMVEHLPKVWVFDSAVESICNGRDVAVPGISKFNPFDSGELIAILTLKDELIALGNSVALSTNIIQREKGIIVQTHKVFMLPGTYT